MLNLTFTTEELAALVSSSEFHDLKYANKEHLNQEISSQLIPLVENCSFPFAFSSDGDLYVNSQVDAKMYLYQNIILRKICKNIRKIYAIQQQCRNSIIRQVKSLLSEHVDIFVLRLDIHHFYDSVNRDSILLMLQEQGKVNYQTIELLKQLFKLPSFATFNGLPKGVSVSAVLSELFMSEFDMTIKNLSGVYYYARYVDDIIIFCNSNECQKFLLKEIKRILCEKKLSLNHKKTILWSTCESKLLIYLGYQFVKNGTMLEISIAPEKINKIKTRITKSFLSYVKNHDYNLLKSRIRYLTGNFSIPSPNSQLPISVGLHSNYYYIGDNNKSLHELQIFYKKLLNCRNGKIALALSDLSVDQKKELNSYSFMFGYSKNVHHYFSREFLNVIKQAWR